MLRVAWASVVWASTPTWTLVADDSILCVAWAATPDLSVLLLAAGCGVAGAARPNPSCLLQRLGRQLWSPRSVIGTSY